MGGSGLAGSGAPRRRSNGPLGEETAWFVDTGSGSVCPGVPPPEGGSGAEEAAFLWRWPRSQQGAWRQDSPVWPFKTNAQLYCFEKCKSQSDDFILIKFMNH